MANYKRKISTGRIVPILSTTERDALTGLIGGETIYNETVGKLQIYNHLTSSWDDAGGSGSGGNCYAVYTQLTYEDDGVNVLLVAADGYIIRRVMLSGGTPFDGTAPTIIVGDADDDDRFVESGDFDLKEAGNPLFEVPVFARYTGTKNIIATIDSDGSAAGSVDIIIEYART